jgi:hypothetical protein
MEVIRKHGGRLRSGAGALVVSVAVVAAVTAGYFGLRHDAALGDAGGGPAARSGAAMAYDPAAGDVVMFGGTNAAGQPLADTWLWDGSGWTAASPATSPPARYGAQMAWDPQSQRVILLGGVGGGGCSTGGSPGIVVPGSAGAASAAAGQTTEIATAASAIAAPSPIASSSGACTQLQDAWAWDGSDWSRVAIGNSSGQVGHYTLAGASMATDAATGKIVLVTADSPAAEGVPLPAINASSGGSATGTASGGSSTVTSSPVAGTANPGTVNPGGPCIGVGGGSCASSVPLPVASATAVPEPTACPLDGGCASLPCASCVICPMTSGSTGGGSTSPGAGTEVICSNCAETGAPCPLLPATLTWVFDGSAFQPVGGSPVDAPPSGGELVWFPGPGVLVDLGSGLYAAMGGTALACPYGAPCPLVPTREEYQWTGAGWTPLQDLSTSASAPYFEVAPVADTATGEAVGIDAMGGTWTATSPESGWVKATYATAPTARSDFALAYDGATGQVVLFGGDAFGASSATGGVTGDTWTWDSSGWILRDGAAPSPSPSPSPSGTASPVASPVILPWTSAVPSSTPTPTAVDDPSPSVSSSPTEPATATPVPAT